MLNRNLELIASLSVPIPGFQTPRSQMAVAASAGEAYVTALILSGSFELEEHEALVASAERRHKGYIRQKRVIMRELTAAALSTKRRSDLPARSFAIPEDRAYPIHDEAHARNALARSSGKPEAARVRRAVCRRYPNMGECSK
jgi:hypothetical protein